jgi:hypothetical protein
LKHGVLELKFLEALDAHFFIATRAVVETFAEFWIFKKLRWVAQNLLDGILCQVVR